MDTQCVPSAKPRKVKVQPLQEILDEKSEESAIKIHRVAEHIRTKIPCVAEFKTYDLALLNSDERLVWNLYWFHMKLTLGGFRQYFANDAEKSPTVRAQLERIGAKNSLHLFDRALAVFPDKRIPETPEAIEAALQQIDENDEHPAHALWAELEQEYKAQQANEFNEQLLAYVREYITDFSTPRTLAQASAQHPEREQRVKTKPTEAKPLTKKITRRH